MSYGNTRGCRDLHGARPRAALREQVFLALPARQSLPRFPVGPEKVIPAPMESGWNEMCQQSTRQGVRGAGR